MKKKVFSLLAVVLFAGSLMSVSSIEESDDCAAEAYQLQKDMEDSGRFTKEYANEFANGFYEFCNDRLN